MNDLIEVLTILAAYGDVPYPTRCTHDTLYFCPAVDASEMKPEDVARLGELDVFENEDGGFYSFRFGSC